MGHKVNEMIAINGDFLTIEISSETIEDMYAEINYKVDEFYDSKLKELELRAIKGKPSDIVAYNLFVSSDRYNRAEMKRKICEELDLILKGSPTFIDT